MRFSPYTINGLVVDSKDHPSPFGRGRGPFGLMDIVMGVRLNFQIECMREPWVLEEDDMMDVISYSTT